MRETSEANPPAYLTTHHGRGGRALLALLGFALLVGCTATVYVPPPKESAAEKIAVANFNLSQCQELSPALYKCPAFDKPLCLPAFSRNDVDCVRLGPKGELLMVP